jgi:hypothetical protein
VWPRFEPGPSRCAFRGVSSVYDTEIVIVIVAKYAYCVLLRNLIDSKDAQLIFFKDFPGKTTKRKESFIFFSVVEQFRRLTSLRRSIIRHLTLTGLLASHVATFWDSTSFLLSRTGLLLIDLGLWSVTAAALKEREF